MVRQSKPQDVQFSETPDDPFEIMADDTGEVGSEDPIIFPSILLVPLVESTDEAEFEDPLLVKRVKGVILLPDVRVIEVTSGIRGEDRDGNEVDRITNEMGALEIVCQRFSSRHGLEFAPDELTFLGLTTNDYRAGRTGRFRNFGYWTKVSHGTAVPEGFEIVPYEDALTQFGQQDDSSYVPRMQEQLLELARPMLFKQD